MTTNPMDAFIDQMAGDNDQLKALVQMMREQQEAEQETEYEEVVEDNDLVEQLHKEKKRSRKFIRLFKVQQEELNFLDGISEELAAALGACSSCWGHARDCEYCRGQGTPGFYPPDRKAFEAFVTPAVLAAPWRNNTSKRNKS